MELPILMVGEVLVSPDIITEMFHCDLDVCKGMCCVEGDAGAPLTVEEIGLLEEALGTIGEWMTGEARSVIARQGVAYPDMDGEMVTSLVGGRDCAFARHEGGRCLCALETAFLRGATSFRKPMSCSLYPVREKVLCDGTVCLNYHRWSVCRAGRLKGEELGVPLYRFLEGPLTERFGEEWYGELALAAEELRRAGRLG